MTDQVKQRKNELDRRGFLRAVGLGAGAAAVGLAAPAEAAPAPAGPPAERQAAGYRETEHVKRAYETFRF
jgi:hypothetical protein